MNSLAELIGKVCKIVLPIKQEYYIGNESSPLAVCTLGSISLLLELKQSGILNDVSIVGRLFTENKGIDSLLAFLYNHKNIKKIFVCGKDVWGHKSGHSLFALYNYGVDENMRIKNSKSREPFLTVSNELINHFRKNIQLINLINETNCALIINQIKKF
jgi:tetrahydromethanopterin S-methyltransferase subunit A